MFEATIVALLLSVGLNIWQLTGSQKLKGVLRAALRKAEQDRNVRVWMPYNQLAELMGWKPEFVSYTNRFTGESETRQASVYPIKEKS